MSGSDQSKAQKLLQFLLVYKQRQQLPFVLPPYRPSRLSLPNKLQSRIRISAYDKSDFRQLSRADPSTPVFQTSDKEKKINIGTQKIIKEDQFQQFMSQNPKSMVPTKSSVRLTQPLSFKKDYQRQLFEDMPLTQSNITYQKKGLDTLHSKKKKIEPIDWPVSQKSTARNPVLPKQSIKPALKQQPSPQSNTQFIGLCALGLIAILVSAVYR